MARKGTGKEAKLSYSGNLLVENRNGLIVGSRVWDATGTAERYDALEMLQDIPGNGRVTVGGDKGCDTADFVRECRNIGVTRTWRKTLDAKEAAHRRMFWLAADHRLLRKVRHRGTLKVDWLFTFAFASSN